MVPSTSIKINLIRAARFFNAGEIFVNPAKVPPVKTAK
jgi:hypothetical protein